MSSRQLSSSWRRRHRKTFVVLLVLGLLICASVLAVIIHHEQNVRAIAADRARFEQADRDMTYIAEQINEATHPEKQTYDKSCQYLHREFAERPLVCQIDITSIYSLGELDSANAQTNLYDNKIKQLPDVIGYKGVTERPRTAKASEDKFGALQSNDLYESMTETLTLKHMTAGCVLSHVLYQTSKPPLYDGISQSTGTFTLSSVISCKDAAKQPYFPLVE